MSSIENLTEQARVADADLFPIFSAANERTRSVSALHLRDYFAGAADAAANVINNRIYPGTYAAAPATRPDGTAPHPGDIYFDTGALSYRWDGASWRASDISTADFSGSSGSGLVGYIQRGSAPVRRSVQDKLREVEVSMLDFYAAADGTDYAPALTRAFAAAVASGCCRVRAPAGMWGLGSTVYIPNSIMFYGDGCADLASGAADRETSFYALASFTSGDLFRFVGLGYTTRDFWSGDIGHFTLIGNKSATSQFGISFRKSTGVAVVPVDISHIHDIATRSLKSGGIEIPDSVVPATFSRLKFQWNGGPGMTINGNGNRNAVLTLDQVSGDGNVGGLILLQNFNKDNVVAIRDIKAERYANPDFAGDEQENVIVFANCDELPIHVYGGLSISAVPSGGFFKKPGNFFRISAGGAPALHWDNLAFRVRATDTGADPSVIDFNSQAIPYTTRNGSFTPDGEERADTSDGRVRQRVLGGPRYRAKSVENSGDQVAGVAPGRSFYEDDAAADEKAWVEIASGGNLSRRTVTDDGGTNNIFERIFRTGAAPLRMEWSVPVRPPVYTTTTLPTASATYTNHLAMVSNPAAGKGRLVYCDAAAWRYVSDDGAV